MNICFLSLTSYPILTKKNLGYAGGAEVEEVHLAKELVSRGYDVSVVTYGHSRNQVEEVDKIKIIKSYERDKIYERENKLRFLLKYMYIWSSLKKANADIYFHEVGSPGVLPLFCHVNRKKFVYRVASDAIVLSRGLSLVGNLTYTKKFIYALEVKKADLVITQSEFQKRILQERFGVRSIVIKVGLPLPQVDHKKTDPPVVLWVGSIRGVKRPDLFVKLAKSIPCACFEMAGGKTEDCQLYQNIKNAARKLPNLTFHGFVPYYKVYELFRRASIFVNTSSIEGFPATFLEAWAHCAPVVSLNVNPDGIIETENLGSYSGTFEQLVLDVDALLKNPELRERKGKNGRKYVEREHDIRNVANKYIMAFQNACR